MERFRTKVHRMADDELLDYYHGINDRIKDIDSGQKGDMLSYEYEKSDMLNQQTFFIGGEAYDLVQKGKIVLEELDKRSLSP